ncbi:uncharacterized protein LOC127179290 isoform X2 [Labeo rohita]|uniref:uncharacterized protein LOC127179290 isoform X2 n=1 Tax=Labeo rohita TaxID=84645 RepID=UPI0021E27311|nr:uncharacterized protein LOC127179290 isoform X2 [Labeo rohita]
MTATPVILMFVTMAIDHHLASFILLLISNTGFSAEISVFVQTGASVQLDIQTQELPEFDDLYWTKDQSENIVKYTNESKKVKVYKNRVNFNDKTFSLTLKNMQKTDSGLYTATASGESDRIISTYRVSVIDAVEPPVLTVSSSWSLHSCSVNFTCRSHDFKLSSTFVYGGCSREEVTSQINTLILNCSEESITCNHSNPVSWKEDRINITQLCEGFSAEISVFVQTGASVQLDIQTQELPKFYVLIWASDKSTTVTYITVTKQVLPDSSYENRVEFNTETFSLILKNMTKTDSGLYTARSLQDNNQFLAEYRVSVIDAVEAPVLTVNSNWSSSDSCTVNFTCRSHELMINSRYQNKSCSTEEVTSNGINTLILNCSENSITCNHSNPVSWKEDRINITQLCEEPTVTTGSSSFSPGQSSDMDTDLILARIKQGQRTLEQYIREFLAITNYSTLPDCIIIELFADGVNEPLRARLRREGPRSSLVAFMNFAFLCVGSSCTVGVAKEVRDNADRSAAQPSRRLAVTPDHDATNRFSARIAREMAAVTERARAMAASAQPAHKMAAATERVNAIAATAVPVHKMAAASERVHTRAATAEPVHKMAARTELCHVTAAIQEPFKVAVTFPESSQVSNLSQFTAALPELSQVSKSSKITAPVSTSSQVRTAPPKASQVTAIFPEPLHKMAAPPEPLHKMAATPESVARMAAKPAPANATSVKPAPANATSAKPQPAQDISVKPQPVHVMFSAPGSTPLMAALPEVVPESSKVTVLVPESSYVLPEGPEPRQVSFDISRSQPIMMAHVLDTPLVTVRAAKMVLLNATAATPESSQDTESSQVTAVPSSQARSQLFPTSQVTLQLLFLSQAMLFRSQVPLQRISMNQAKLLLSFQSQVKLQPLLQSQVRLRLSLPSPVKFPSPVKLPNPATSRRSFLRQATSGPWLLSQVKSLLFTSQFKTPLISMSLVRPPRLKSRLVRPLRVKSRLVRPLRVKSHLVRPLRVKSRLV